DPHWAGRLSSLGDALSAGFEHTKGESDRAAAISAYAKATRQELAGPSVRIRAARAAATLTAQSDPGRAAGFLEAAVRLLGEISPRGLTGKHSLSLARGSGPWPVMPVRAGLVRSGSGCLGECDGVAECFELADVAAGLALLVGAAGVVVAAEGAGGGGGVG